MKKILKQHWSNILFVGVVLLILNTPIKEWVLRQLAFSPSVASVETNIKNYKWQLKGLNAQSLDFEELKGKVVFVNFWATWCPPCRAELPMIQNLYEDYKGKVVFVFVTNEEWPTVSSFFDENEYSLPVYNSISIPPVEFRKTQSIPASYLISKKGTIVVQKVGAADWNSKKTRLLIDDLLQEDSSLF